MGLASVTHQAVQKFKKETQTATTRAHVGNKNAAVTATGLDGWRDLGCGNPGSFAYDGNKEILDIFTGAPRTIQERHVTSWQGSVNYELYDYTGEAIELINGTTLRRSLTAATIDAMDTTIDEVGSGITTTNTTFGVFSLQSLTVGDAIAVFSLEGVAAAGGDWEEVAKVEDISGVQIFVDGNGLSQVPPDGARVLKIASERQPIGGNALRDYKFRTITSTNKGDIFLVFSELGNFTGPMNPNNGDGTAAVMLPMTFGSIGFAETVPGFTCEQVKIWDHYIIYGKC